MPTPKHNCFNPNHNCHPSESWDPCNPISPQSPWNVPVATTQRLGPSFRWDDRCFFIRHAPACPSGRAQGRHPRPDGQPAAGRPPSPKINPLATMSPRKWGMSDPTQFQQLAALPAIQQPSRQDSLKSLHRAAQGSKTSFSTLVSLAASESSFNTAAVSKKSSAAGPFQITENTWLHLVKKYGAAQGRSDLASMVSRAQDGTLSVSDENRAAVLGARHEIGLSASLAAKLMDENRASLNRRLGREPSESEVRMSYFLGVTGATRLINTAETNPDAPVKGLLPRAYANHRSMFSEQGKPITAAQAVATLDAKFTAEFAQAQKTKPVPMTSGTLVAAMEQKPLPLPGVARPEAAVVQVAEVTPEQLNDIAPAAGKPTAPKPLDCTPGPNGSVSCTL